MIIVMKPDVSEEEINHIVARLEKLGLRAHISRGEHQTIIGAIGDESILNEQPIEAISGVERVLPIVKPWKLASRDFHPGATTVHAGSGSFGTGALTLAAGPPVVEDEEQTLTTARALAAAGAAFLRSAAYKPRTSPYAFQGLGKRGLEILAQVSAATGLPVITEVLDPRSIDLVAEYAAVIQIGSQNIQNYDLLREAGKQKKPILLKRGIMSTLSEFLLAAEYILSQGNNSVILCDCGIRTFEQVTRSALDVSAIPFLKQETHLPVVVDPSQAAGNSFFVAALAMAAVAAGADGVCLDVHPDPESAMVHGNQSILPAQFAELAGRLAGIHAIVAGA